MTATTIRTGDPRELLALIPHQLGFQPEESLVVVSLRGETHRVGLIARVDLDALSPEVFDSLAGHLQDDGAEKVFAVIYTAEDWEPTALALISWEADAVYVVTDSTYFDVRTQTPRPLSDLTCTQVAATLAYEGSAPAASRGDLGRIEPASAAARAAATRARKAWQGSPADALSRFVAWRDSETPGAITPEASGILTAALADVLTRDAFLLAFIEGEAAEEAADALLVRGDSAAIAPVLNALFRPGGAKPGDRAKRAEAVLTTMVSHTTDPAARVPMLSLLAFLAWWSGEGARANVFVDQALAIDPRYRLARLLLDALAVGMPPGWAR